MSIDETTLKQIEKQFSAGISSADILDVFACHEVKLTESTLRKYVQLGLLPRSVRVGRKGKHQGSQGMYPVGVVRQIVQIKELMAKDFTIEQIQRDFLFMRSDVQLLEQTLATIFRTLGDVLKDREGEGYASAVSADVAEARAMSRELIAKLDTIESRLSSRARIRSVN